LTVEETGFVDLNIVDPLDWSDVHADIFALQKKLDLALDCVALRGARAALGSAMQRFARCHFTQPTPAGC
jgi:hypothetical protein